jgi:hypothetical protein
MVGRLHIQCFIKELIDEETILVVEQLCIH